MLPKIKYGVTRIVFVFNNFVIKIPNIRYSHLNFLEGCIANWSERSYYKVHSTADYEGNMAHFVAPSYWCSWFGLVQIQAKCEPLIEDLTDEQREFFDWICKGDNKQENFGLYKNKIVCLDYPI